MTATTDTPLSLRTRVKPRPRWLKALGAESPPDTLEIGGVPHRRVEVFKHDSWAATALYESPWGLLRIVKLHRQQSVFGVPMRWLGRRAATHEREVLKNLGDLPGIPMLHGTVQAGGRTLPNAVAREFIKGHPLGQSEDVSNTFFPHLRVLLKTMHDRRIVYVDLHKRENIIVDAAGKPCLIDFQISLLWPRWLPLGPLYRIFCGSDEYHLMKHWRRCRPDQCAMEGIPLERKIPWWIWAHRRVARPFRELRRRLLVQLGVRAGKGRVETEAFAEHALRDTTPSADRAA